MGMGLTLGGCLILRLAFHLIGLDELHQHATGPIFVDPASFLCRLACLETPWFDNDRL